jgi:hypothetical protein
MRPLRAVLLLAAILAALCPLVGVAGAQPRAHAAATCADYPNQAAAQRAADTIDADGDGVYCESLPCPCAGPSTDSNTVPSAPSSRRSTLTRGVVSVGLSRTRYPAVLAHIRAAVARGWPAVTRIHRAGAERRRDRALAGIPTRRGQDRDEWPMAMARRTWRTDVAYVPSGQNRGAGAVVSIKLGRYCDGQRFRVVAY